ncbi:hypothetical protein [Phreatobacter oligotrophus]|uniref:hypothetical protein n=1 Tax=Phreatobacter oligotrophus TaxID=1122261 RepID=UPI002353261A|nr:hypothetical protein [Phreatobacter oligotrophus]MBX9991013.1 hypothetical protein [Phreatobacter oligotrophus]
MKDRSVLKRLSDWSMVAASFGLVLFAAAALRPPHPAGSAIVTTPTTPAVVAAAR